jgi:tripartite-type tricarboxylate transporter receptor subunit TctC
MSLKRRDCLALLAALPAASIAQAEYPRPGSTIRYVVPFPPGGLTDVMARLVGQQLGTRRCRGTQ